MQKNILVSVFFLASFLFSTLASAEEWDKVRDLNVDKELTNMIAASAILEPGKHENSNMNPKQAMIHGLSPSDAATAKGSNAGGVGAEISSTGTGSLSSSESSGTPLVESNTDINLGSGATGATGENLLDTNLGGSTDGGISTDTSTNVIGEETTVGADIGGGDYLVSADVTAGDTEASVDLTPTESFDSEIIGATTDIGAEIDASGNLSGSEADIGIEADVDGSVSGDDIGSDPADGLSTSTSTTLL